MFKVLRIKATSSCIGIRRKVLAYTDLHDGEYNFKTYEYPLSKIKFIYSINEDTLKFQDQTIKLSLANEEQFYIKNEVSTIQGDIIDEHIFINIMLMPLDIEAIPYYENAIKNGDWFDESKGEFEYLIGLIYENSNDFIKSQEYFKIASCYNFLPAKFKIRDIN